MTLAMRESNAAVVAVSSSPTHSFSKPNRNSIRLLAGLGVDGDAHAGTTVKHRSRVKPDPPPNLRQVHLIHAELLDELREDGFNVTPGQMGENVTTRGVNLLNLPVGAKLRLCDDAVVEVTGLRNPCVQLDRFQTGLMSAVREVDESGRLIGKVGVMAIVLIGGEVQPGDSIHVELPPVPHRRLERV